MLAVLDPVNLMIDNYPEEQTEILEAHNNLENFPSWATADPLERATSSSAMISHG